MQTLFSFLSYYFLNLYYINFLALDFLPASDEFGQNAHNNQHTKSSENVLLKHYVDEASECNCVNGHIA